MHKYTTYLALGKDHFVVTYSLCFVNFVKMACSRSSLVSWRSPILIKRRKLDSSVCSKNEKHIGQNANGNVMQRRGMQT